MELNPPRRIVPEPGCDHGVFEKREESDLKFGNVRMWFGKLKNEK